MRVTATYQIQITIEISDENTCMHSYTDKVTNHTAKYRLCIVHIIYDKIVTLQNF